MFQKKKWNEILKIISGKNQKDVQNENGKYPIYGSGGVMGFANDFLCPANTVVVGRKGTINHPLFVAEPFWNIDTAFGVVAGASILPKFLYYFCLQFNFKSLDKSTGRPSVSKSDLLKIEMPVPPLDEQARIVARIEELFSELDNGVQTLQTIKQQLAVYRQAVLKESFQMDYESKTELSEIVDEIKIGPFGTMLHKSDYREDGVPVINPQQIKGNSILVDKAKRISNEKAQELSSYLLKPNDIIMGRRGEMGRTAAITEDAEVCICGTGSIILRLKKEFDAGLYAKLLSSPDAVSYLEKHATGTTMNNLNEKIVKHIPVPAILREKQIYLTRKMEERLSICDSIEKTVNTALAQAEAMRQSILKKAFEGGLV